MTTTKQCVVTGFLPQQKQRVVTGFHPQQKHPEKLQDSTGLSRCFECQRSMTRLVLGVGEMLLLRGPYLDAARAPIKR